MDKYETIEIVGEGSYGVVLKCKHRETGQLVAIKRFLETEEDRQIRKMAFREIRMLKVRESRHACLGETKSKRQKLRHENLVNMIEVFRRRKRFYLVFEFLDHTLLDELNGAARGLGWEVSKRHVFQVLRGLSFCHGSNIMHRDVKPENILVSPSGVIKLCDFGFARFVSGPNESCTDYVATRWYRAPELLVGDPRYGKSVDVWAVGCLYAEMVNGEPLFAGDSDVDQLYRITRALGGLCTKHRAIMGRSRPGRMLRHASADELVGPPQAGIPSVRKLFPTWDATTVNFMAQCLRMDPALRPKCSALLQHPFFAQNGFRDRFLEQLAACVLEESSMNPLIAVNPDPKVQSRPRRPVTLKMAPSWRMFASRDESSVGRTKSEATEPLMEHPSPSSALLQPSTRHLFYSYHVSVSPPTAYLRRRQRNGHAVLDSDAHPYPKYSAKAGR